MTALTLINNRGKHGCTHAYRRSNFRPKYVYRYTPIVINKLVFHSKHSLRVSNLNSVHILEAFVLVRTHNMWSFHEWPTHRSLGVCRPPLPQCTAVIDIMASFSQHALVRLCVCVLACAREQTATWSLSGSHLQMDAWR